MDATIPNRDTRIEWVPIDSVRPNPRNPRKNDDAVPVVAQSIKRFGFANPILVDRDGMVIAGHTRLRAARELGMSTVPVVRLEYLSPHDALALAIADNKTGEIARSDTSFDERLRRIAGGVSAAVETHCNRVILARDLSALRDLLALVASPADAGVSNLPTGPRGDFETVTFMLTHRQADALRTSLERERAEPLVDPSDNDNSNARALESLLVRLAAHEQRIG